MRLILIKDSVKRIWGNLITVKPSTEREAPLYLIWHSFFPFLYDIAYLFNSNNFYLLFFVHPPILLPLFSFPSLVCSCPLLSSLPPSSRLSFFFPFFFLPLIFPCLLHPPSLFLDSFLLLFTLPLYRTWIHRGAISTFLFLYRITYSYNSISTLKEKILLYRSIVHSYSFSLQWMASYL